MAAKIIRFVVVDDATQVITATAAWDDPPLVVPPYHSMFIAPCRLSAGFALDPDTEWPAVGMVWGGGSPGPAPSYLAPAVGFDGSVIMTIAELASTDSGLFSGAFWFKVDSGGDVNPFSIFQIGNNTNPGGAINGFLATFDEDGASTSNDPFFINFVEDPSLRIDLEGVSGGQPSGQWNFALFSVDVSVTDARKAKFYLNDVDVTPPDIDAGAAFDILTDGFAAVIGGGPQGTKLIGALANLWLAADTSLLDETGDIPEETRRLFITSNGTPADPAGFPEGGTIVCVGGVDTFPVNAGDGGDIVVSDGDLSDAGYVNAS